MQAQEVGINLQINPSVANAWQKLSAQQFYKTTSAADTLDLPFLDDFSKGGVYPDSTLWQDKFVFINRTWAMNPPTLGVATFEGLDQNGYPYNFNASISSSNLADHLTSKYIRMGTSLSAADSVYLSFFYQAKGIGNEPEPNDSLILEFRTPTKNWTRVWYKKGYLPTVTDTLFHLVMVPVKDASYFENGFQLRFKNYATLCGNLDHWHIDNVYLNKNRTKNDTVFKDMSFVYNSPSLLKNYMSMPWEQFQSAEMKDTLHMVIRNNDTTSNNTSYVDTVYDNTGSIIGNYNGGLCNVQPFLTTGYDNCTTHLKQKINFSFPAMADTATFTTKHVLSAITDVNRKNDTLKCYQQFKNYYAYDDGTAEEGYGLSGTNAKLAVQFKVNVTDTIRGIQLFFNPIVNNVNLAGFKIAVWNDNAGKPNSVIKDSAVYLKYGKHINEFTTYLFNPGQSIVLTPGIYYAGWIQTSNTLLNIGRDKNTNSQSKTFFNTSGTWQNTSLKESIMVRPLLGNKSVITNVEAIANAIQDYEVYPNPANDKLHIDFGNFRQIKVNIYDIAGRQIFSENSTPDFIVDIANLSAGIYFIAPQSKEVIYPVKKIIISK